MTHLIRVMVDDVASPRSSAPVSTGRASWSPPTDREYGDRDCTVEDLAGHRWQFAETLRDVAPEEFGCETVEAWSHGT